MNFSDSYPVWSTGTDNSFNMNNKIPQYKESESGRNDQNSNHTLNTSEVPAWEHNDSSWVQNDMYKTGLETDSLNSGGETSSSQENLPIWSNAGQGESQWSTLGNSQEMWGTNEETPLWDSNPGTWDHDSATRLAEKLLQCQHMDTASFASGVDNESKDGSPMISQDGKTGQFISPNPRFKTEFCRNFREKGECIYGNQCQFAHGKAELRHDMIRHNKYKTKLCQKYWIKGWCAYGTRCNFIHQEEEQHVAEKTRVVVHQSGFRPLMPTKSLRKSSESSADSGVDVNNMYNRALGQSEACEVTSMFNKTINMPDLDINSKRMKLDIGALKNDVVNTSFQNLNGNQWNQIKVKDMEKDSDMFNMNLATELNRNLYLDVVKVKDSRPVPHPEDNPIPVSNNQPFNPAINGQYRMMKPSGTTLNTWPF